MKRSHWILVLLAWAVPAQTLVADTLQPKWEDVRPIFETNCVNCHSEHGASKGLRLDSYEAVLKGGANGAVVLAGDAAGSELVRRLRGESSPRMPFLSKPLPQGEVDLIVLWVEAGLLKASRDE